MIADRGDAKHQQQLTWPARIWKRTGGDEGGGNHKHVEPVNPATRRGCELPGMVEDDGGADEDEGCGRQWEP